MSKIKAVATIKSPNSSLNNSVNSTTVSPIMKYLLYAGMGICILILMVVTLKILIGSDNETIEETENNPDILSPKDKEEQEMIKHELHTLNILPGLFNKPLQLFSQGDRKEIKNIDNEIESLEALIKKYDNDSEKNVCNYINNKIFEKDLSENYEVKDNKTFLSKNASYINLVYTCSLQDECSVEKSKTLLRKCDNKDNNNDNCSESYIKSFLSGNKDSEEICEEPKCLSYQFNIDDYNDKKMVEIKPEDVENYKYSTKNRTICKFDKNKVSKSINEFKKEKSKLTDYSVLLG